MLQMASLQECKSQFFHLGFNQIRSACKWVVLWEICGFCILRHNPHGQKILKNAIIIDISLFKLNSLSNSRIGLINQSLDWKPYFCIGGFDWKPLTLIPASKSW